MPPRLILPSLMLLGAIVFSLGINWGLPNRSVDKYLFGNHPVWTGQQIVALAPPEQTDRGADVDANPIVERTKIVVLNETDAQRAEIIRRYRLFSYQPDEMITFKSLASIRQFQGDPRLYQYGGLWVYPVGAMLKCAGLMKLIELRNDRAFYFDHPEAFGRFYIVARLYSVLWGVVGVWVVYALAQKLSMYPLAAPAACLAFIFLPVVINLSHEAKPHLAGAVLQLLAILAATKYTETSRPRWYWCAGALCGAAFGMVLSAMWIFVVLPIARLAKEPFSRSIMPTLAGIALGLLVYCFTNPFVPINLIWNPQIVFSNLGNSSAMYQVTRFEEGAINTARLIAEGTSTPLALAGLIGLPILFRRNRTTTILLLAPAGLVGLQMVLIGAGKPPEYGRFALLLDAGLAISGIAALFSLSKPVLRHICCLAILGWTIFAGIQYSHAFLCDTNETTTRLRASDTILQAHPTTLALLREPAPYNCPPMDLFAMKLQLLPPDQSPGSGDWDILVRPIEAILPFQLWQSPMSWANKKFVIRGQHALKW